MNQAPRTWRLILLGRTALLDPEGNIVRLSTQKCMILLAILALSDRPLTRMQIAETVWPDSDRKAARDSLRTALAGLRKSLPVETIVVGGDTIHIDHALLVCDAGAIRSGRDYTGDFMPGLDHDWVIDQRLRIRDFAVSSLLADAQAEWDEARRKEALSLADRAAEIDPLSEEAAMARIRFRDQMGQRTRAVEISDAFRVKSMRNLGVVSDVRPETHVPEDHPLFVAAEWFLDREPAQAGALLASTHSQWLGMPVERALDLHERTLKAWTDQHSARMLVESQRMCLLVIAGRLAPRLEEAQRSYQDAISAGECLVAAKLAGAIAYGYLSKGDFKQSVVFAERARAAATLLQDRTQQIEFDVLLGIILQQVGQTGRSRALLRSCEHRAEEHGTPYQIASLRLSASNELVWSGKLDGAVTALDTSRRLYESSGFTRMLPWVLHGEATLFHAAGEHERARAKLLEIKGIGPEVGGHSVTAMTDDWLACVDCKRGELDQAAEALARATLCRRKAGSVPSVYERVNVLPAKRMLKERLRPDDVRAAYRRAARSQPR